MRGFLQGDHDRPGAADHDPLRRCARHAPSARRGTIKPPFIPQAYSAAMSDWRREAGSDVQNQRAVRKRGPGRVSIHPGEKAPLRFRLPNQTRKIMASKMAN